MFWYYISALIERTFGVTSHINELVIDILSYARLAEQMPTLLNVKESINIE